jgi:molecular chaperone DnaK
MSRRVGIDLGTTQSSVSFVEGDSVETIELEAANGSTLLPSVVYYPEDGGDPVVGVAAKHQKEVYPDRVVDLIKRSMGEQEHRHEGTGKTPPEVSSEILKTIRREAGNYLGEEVEDAVITVPAYFGEYERAHTREAAELAGLNVLSLLPEPHAAALAYSVSKPAKVENRHLLVYDLGGGTFDVTLIHVTRKKTGAGSHLAIETLEKAGDKRCGGADWDRALFEIVAKALAKEHGFDAMGDPRSEAHLLEKCEQAKRDLSRAKSAIVVGEDPVHEVEVTRVAFRRAVRDLLFSTQTSLELVLHKAEQKGVAKEDISVMLCGGSSQMPMVGNMIKRVMGRRPMVHANPELLVSVGAAYWAQLATGELVETSKGQVSVEEGGLKDSAASGIGVSLSRDSRPDAGKYVRNIIPAGSAYDGTEYRIEARTIVDRQTSVSLPFYEGDSEDLDECKFLGMFKLTGLPRRGKGQPIDVYLAYDSDGIIKGRGVDRQSATKVDIIIERPQGSQGPS